MGQRVPLNEIKRTRRMTDIVLFLTSGRTDCISKSAVRATKTLKGTLWCWTGTKVVEVDRRRRLRVTPMGTDRRVRFATTSTIIGRLIHTNIRITFKVMDVRGVPVCSTVLHSKEVRLMYSHKRDNTTGVTSNCTHTAKGLKIIVADAKANTKGTTNSLVRS